MKFDFVIAGSGLTGATIARRLTDAGKRVYVVERRAHIGGNARDEMTASGIRRHCYGPHYFRTNSARLWKWAQRFGAFYPYEARVMTQVDGRLEHWPIQEETIVRMCGKYWRKMLGDFGRSTRREKDRNFETACLAIMPRIIYEKFVKGYTEKQWGVPAHRLSAGLARRFEVRTDGDTRLSRHKYQGLPVNGYSAWIERMLEGIPVVLNCDFLEAKRPKSWTARRVVFTGCVDEYFGFDLGRLVYRCQHREHKPPGMFEGPAQVNYPGNFTKAIRKLNWAQMEPAATERGLATYEFPRTAETSDECEYPFPDEANRKLAERYQQRAAKTKNLTICGRLGEYKYYDMDQAMARAMVIAERLLKS